MIGIDYHIGGDVWQRYHREDNPYTPAGFGSVEEAYNHILEIAERINMEHGSRTLRVIRIETRIGDLHTLMHETVEVFGAVRLQEDGSWR